jgi:hypothetical protein
VTGTPLRSSKRRGRLKAVLADIPAPSDREPESLEFRSILDFELGKISPKLREILVLCLLEGRTAEEASHELGCPVGTVKSRLARGREALRGGLTARGLAPAAVFAVVAGTPRSALASPVSRALSLSTVRVATLAPERIPHAVVALLPFWEQGALFEEFNLSEPWDSPHNRALIARMPEVFTTPSSPTPAGTTRIRAFGGPNTLFAGRTGTSIATMTDGTSNTLAIVAANDPAPWTRPGELPFIPGQVRPVLDNSDERGALVGVTDGSARYISGATEAFWRMFITPAGNEVLSWAGISSSPDRPAETPPSADRLTPLLPTAPVPTNATPVPAPAISPDLEARLRAIEAKLDHLMRKLDGDDQAPSKR